MDPLTNPFAVLTFIAAPAILTNASSVMALGTSNRFARAIDRVRALSAELASQHGMTEALKQLRLKQLRFASRRVLLVIRALTAFYVSLGAFAATSLTSLLGASLVLAHLDVPRVVIMVVAFVCGTVGICGLVTGSVLLVWESRLTFAILREETNFVVEGLHLGKQEHE
jgi:Protein of unknown function (DUF2721)